MKLTVEQVRAFFDYNPDSGALTWKERPASSFRTPAACKAWNKCKPGKQAGTRRTTKSGVTYLHVTLFGQSESAHVLAWMHFHGSRPACQIDHQDGCGTNNAILNLRDVSGPENNMNMKKYRTNKSGVAGVYFCNTSNRWIAKAQKALAPGHSKVYRARCATLEEAVSKRESMLLQLGFHPNHGRTAEERSLYLVTN